ncbi:NTF2 fold immunity protein [Pseudomonas sp. Sample_16]|uniref:NTF2 fold immunity protein n=1 Tax=Pseudomonas sp. Sample_16 TaxID=2448263 RepID=UPI0015AAE2E4|nr:NTF2 fold immunity protein [Pseudomonas sp. Sample_16]
MAKYSSTNTGDSLREVVYLTLNGFMNEMYGWEKKYYKKSMEALEDESLEESLQNHMRADLLIIFSKYVVQVDRNYDRLANLVCGSNPEYDPENDNVGGVEVKGDFASVVIEKNTGLSTVYRLVFSVKDGNCVIQGRDFKSGGKWSKTYV